LFFFSDNFVFVVRTAAQYKLLELSLAQGLPNTARKECQWWKIDEQWNKKEGSFFFFIPFFFFFSNTQLNKQTNKQ
jgi:hypothetical protein